MSVCPTPTLPAPQAARDSVELFSARASGYAQFRPHYPASLFAWLAGQCRQTDTALDIAAGNGQAAKICNNLILGVTMIAVSEAFVLAEKLGLEPQKLFDVASKSSGQCWSLTSYCPVPGPVTTSPANRDYKAGFTAAMMLKDLKLAQDVAKATRATSPLGAGAAAVYQAFIDSADGNAGVDFSGIIRFLRDSTH
jgi:hypothetical protein